MFKVQKADIAIFDKSHLFILNKHKYLQKSCLTTTYLCFLSLFNNVKEKFLYLMLNTLQDLKLIISA